MKTRGAPKKVYGPEDLNNPDNYPTLIAYLAATNKIQHTNGLLVMKARSMYLKNISLVQISKTLKMPMVLLDRLVLSFAWDEQRERMMFEQYRRIGGMDRRYGKNVAERHDRIAATIEGVAEQMLQRQADGEIKVSPKDLATLATAVKTTQEIRRTARGEAIARAHEERTNNPVQINIAVPAIMEKVAGALTAAVDRPKLLAAPTRTIAVGTESEIGSDVEYETADREPA